MVKIFETQFQNGSYIENVSKVAGTPTALTFRQTKKGKSLAYVDNTSLLSYGNLSNWNLGTGDFTIACAFKYNKHAAFAKNLFGKRGTETTWVRLNIDASNLARFEVSASAGGIGITGPAFVEGREYLVIGRRQGGVLQLWVNNVSAGTAANTYSINNTGNVTFFKFSTEISSNVNIYSGQLYDTALSTNERNQLYKEFLESTIIEKPIRFFANPKPTDLSYETGLVAAYSPSPMTVQGGQLLDISGNDRHATLLNGVLTNNDNCFFAGNARLTMAGFSNPGITNNGVITIVARVKSSDYTLRSGVLYTGAVNGQILGFDGNIHSFTGSTTRGTIPLVNNRTYTIAAVYNGVTMSLYVNGVLDTTNTVSHTVGDDWLIGRANNDTRHFPGNIYDLKIYNYAFTPEQVKAYHNSFIKPVLLEDFSNYAVLDTFPKGWQKGTGAFVIQEDVTRKFLTCTSNGTITMNLDLDAFADNGYIEIDRYASSAWTTHKSTVYDLKSESWFDYSNKTITLTAVTGERFANIKIFNGVKL